jgi:hypothetical protein
MAAAAEAAEAQALAFLVDFEEMNRTLLLCGFTSPVQHFRLIDQEGLDTLELFGGKAKIIVIVSPLELVICRN